MIFVTVGTHNQGFERLIKKMDEIAGKIEEEIVIQTGFTDYEPVNAKWFKFKDLEGIKEYYKKARLIVAHAGAGTLIDALSFGKCVITIPRLKEFGEHVDDQQLELTEVLEESNKIMAVTDIKKLESVIKNTLNKDCSVIKIDVKLKTYIKNLLQE